MTVASWPLPRSSGTRWAVSLRFGWYLLGRRQPGLTDVPSACGHENGGLARFAHQLVALEDLLDGPENVSTPQPVRSSVVRGAAEPCRRANHGLALAGNHPVANGPDAQNGARVKDEGNDDVDVVETRDLERADHPPPKGQRAVQYPEDPAAKEAERNNPPTHDREIV